MVNEAIGEAYQGPERRKSERIQACFIVTYKLSKRIEMMWLEDRIFTAMMMDLSQGGMAISTEKNIPTQALLSIGFTLYNIFTNESRSMQMEGEVRYNSLLKERAHRLGIAFTQIDEEDKFEIAKFVNMTRTWDASS